MKPASLVNVQRLMAHRKVSAGLEELRKQATEGDGKDEKEQEDVNNPWKVLAKTAGWASSNSWKPVAYVNNDESDSQDGLAMSVVLVYAFCVFWARVHSLSTIAQWLVDLSFPSAAGALCAWLIRPGEQPVTNSPN
eukprot:432320-Pelagomonas_calceolata.AAC.6